MFLAAAAAASLALAAPPPGPLADLVASVSALSASSAVKARVEHRLAVTQGEEPPRPDGVVTAQVAAGPEGLQVAWSGAVLAAAEREAQQHDAAPEAPTPVKDALFDLRPLDLAHALDAAPELLRILAQAELVEAATEERDGVALRVLRLKVTPALSARDRKYVKELTATVRLWLGPDGLPVAGEQEVKLKGRAFLVITFGSEQMERYRFARVGDRLLVARHERDERSEGSGEKTHRHSVTEVTVQP